MLVNSARVSAHHFLPQSGWVSYWIKGEQDIPNVIELFKMRYDFLKPNTKLVTRTTCSVFEVEIWNFLGMIDARGNF